nr:diacylglycerol kinase family protein [uncultured Treponema sp.]
MIYIFINKLSNNGKAVYAQDELEKIFKGQELKFIDITGIINAADSCKMLNDDDMIVVAGGDGTLSRFANDVYDLQLKQEIYFYTCGSGNDFLNDVRERCEIKNNLIPMNEFIKNLPLVTVNGKTCRFINGIGYGIDGYCCEEGDRIRANSDKKVNYTAIAIKGLLGKFKSRNAKITVDGVTTEYKEVWLAPTMLGRFFGGGMMITPKQDRLNAEHLVSSVVVHNAGKLKILTVFPKIFKGKHVTHTDIYEVKLGHEVRVEFDKPCALQVDGETFLNVKYYTVSYH